MAKLTAAGRRRIAPSNFALPGDRYPIEDENHARNALARVSQFGSSGEKATVRAKVHAKYPGIGHSKGGYVPNPAQNAAIHAKGSHPHMHALALASATHLKNMGHITPEHHARIERHVNNALTQLRGPQPAMPAQPQPEAAPFGSFAPPSTAGYA